MQILKGAITQLASRGHLTLQVPECAICKPGTNVEMEEAPDEWFCVLKHNCVPASGKESGFLYLTRAGYEANKDALRTAFESAIEEDWDKDWNWPAFEKMAEAHFQKVEKAITKQKKLLEQKLNQLNGFVA